MPLFIPVDRKPFPGHHCVGIQVANGNSSTTPHPTLPHSLFCLYIQLGEIEEEKKATDREIA